VTSVSVIMPVLNEERIIEGALSRLAGMGGDFEVIVVDNGSTDGTLGLASQRAKTITSAPGRGPAMNAGAAVAAGEVLLFLHADTHLPDRAFQGVEAAISVEGAVGGCFSVAFDGDDWRGGLVTLLYRAFSRLGFFYGDAAIFVRRDTFWSLGGYKPMALMEDFDLCLRLRKAGRTTRLPLTVSSSSRRWRQQGFLKTLLVFFAIQGLYLVGYRRPSLFKLYRAIR
jgi:rSAM/selenodomain-associated transferase 2